MSKRRPGTDGDEAMGRRESITTVSGAWGVQDREGGEAEDMTYHGEGVQRRHRGRFIVERLLRRFSAFCLCVGVGVGACV